MPVDSAGNEKPPITRVADLDESSRKLMEAGLLFADPTPEQKLDSAIRDALSSTRDLPDQQERLKRIIDKVSGFEDKEALKIFVEGLSPYACHQGIDDDAEEGLVKKLLPAIEKRDPAVDVLIRGGVISAMNKGEFGVGEFLCHSYALRINPANLNELQMVLKDIPTTNAARFDQNRHDAYYVDSSLRELVHDQRPYVHELISAMVRFYEIGDKEGLEKALFEGRRYENGRYPSQFDSLGESVFAREYYEEDSRKEREEDPSEKVIDVLRRLEKNTEPIEENPPATSDAVLNKFLNDLSISESPKGPNMNALAQALDYVNEELVSFMAKAEIGIEPNKVLAINWLERQCFKSLQTLTFEDQVGAYKQPWFASILKFHELANSTQEFNPIGFDEFVNKLEKLDYQSAYKLIAERVLNNVASLARKYKSEGKERWLGALWSGNTTHELVGLTDLRQAETTFGKMKFAEDVKLPWQRVTGD